MQKKTFKQDGGDDIWTIRDLLKRQKIKKYTSEGGSPSRKPAKRRFLSSQ